MSDPQIAHYGARFLVSGRVQGVAFRANTRLQAHKLGLSGYAMNLPDGRVEVLAIGSTAALLALERWLAVGPAFAKVTTVERFDADVERLSEFAIL